MPGLSELRNARAPEIRVQHMAFAGGEMIVYTTKNPRLLAAQHHWFDAQLSDHGSGAMTAHDHSTTHHQ
jgi:hypothetical protein